MFRKILVAAAVGFALSANAATPLVFDDTNTVRSNFFGSSIFTFSINDPIAQNFDFGATSSPFKISIPWIFGKTKNFNIKPVTFTGFSLTRNGTAVGITSNGLGTSSASLVAYGLVNGPYSLTVNYRGPRRGLSTFAYHAAVSPVPEPASIAMMLAGLGVIGAAVARRRKVDAGSAAIA